MSKLAALYRTASWPLRVVGTLIVLGVTTILFVGFLTAAGGDIKE